MIVRKTYYPNADNVSKEWVLVDADGENLGRLATKISTLILGKHKPQFTPGVDVGDHVIVINAKGVKVTGKKLDQKIYYRESGYQSGLKQITLRDQLEKKPERVIEHAVYGMLPHNRFGRKLRKKLKVYAGPDHPHQAQQPKPIEEVLS
ncbi:MAG: 50S ribosomal protein L13 [Anaerolineales bacterium]|nr:50S ribosomal protein L13 [Anaerolineales bacterium]MBS3752271.1 50S ribosomal protein L13 [Anaerolineales bacterium]